MKKLNVIYNHNIYESPYNQNEVKKTETEIEKMFGEDMAIFVTHTSMLAPNPFFYACDFIQVEHSFDMTADDKKTLADILNRSVTKLKSEEPIDVIVSFRRIHEDDLYYFQDGKSL